MVYDSDLDCIGEPLLSLDGQLCGAWTSEGGGGVEPLNSQGKDNFILMQFTGLKDKNGKELWEGDIVRFEYNESIHRFASIEFYEGRFITRYKGEPDTLNKNWVEDLEILGDIYSNPELLKV